MKAKLIKTSKDSHHNGHYFLNDDNGFAIGSSDKDWCKRAVTKKPLYVLSLKNCQAIERGYDLDELVKIDKEKDLDFTDESSFRRGFLKALELMGDKRFSEEDMYKMFIFARSIDTAKKHIKKLEDIPIDELFNDFIKSIQQTEWDVVIVEEQVLYSANMPKEDESRPPFRPKLDSKGRLILKRI